MKKSKPLNKKQCIIYCSIAILFIITAIIFLLYQRQKAIEEKVTMYTKLLSEYEERFSYYYYAQEKDTYTTLIGNYRSALDSKDLSVLETCQLELNSLEKTIIEKNKSLFNKKIEKLKNADLTNAYDNELKQIADISSTIQLHFDNHHFTKITPLLEEWTTILSNMTFVADNLSIYVNQINTSDYPTVNLYLSIHDIENDKVPSYLVKNFLYLNETTVENKINTKTSSNCTVLRMEQLDNNLPLSITIATDIGNNRSETELITFKNAITNFLDTMQFHVNDQIELISIADKISIYQKFSSNKEKISNSLAKLKSTTNDSYFYDGLMKAITRSASHKNAKCVIALTDKEDTKSSYKWEEVVAYANECSVPLFIIGVGKNISPYVLERLATKTNGFYRNVNDFSSIETIFTDIYKQIKGFYQVTYQSELKWNTKENNKRFLHIAYQNRLFGGSCDYSYVPISKTRE